MLTLSDPRKLNGKIDIDLLRYDLLYAMEDDRTYMFSINQQRPTLYHAGTTDPRLYLLTIYREYVTIDAMGEDIYNSIGIQKIVKVQLETNEQKVLHMISLTDIKDLQRFKRVVEGMIIGLNEKLDENWQLPPLSQWGTAITHSTSHGTW